MTNATTHENARTVRRLFEQGFNQRDFALIDELVDADYVDAAGERGPAAFRQLIERLHGAFPDITYTIDETVAEADAVAVRWRWTGTHRGVFRGIAPTERALTNTGAGIFRVRRGKVAAASIETDRLGFLQSIGVVAPTDALFKPRAAESHAA
ncbi:MAG TPA: ester cyclase [Polyangiaceae bacterium]|nr:ester cyclase [Polyangiaceae bacterium]